MDKETKRTLGRLAEWFGMMGFAESSDAMAAECLEYGDGMYVKRTKRMPTGADRLRMQRCWSPSRFPEDVKGFPGTSCAWRSPTGRGHGRHGRCGARPPVGRDGEGHGLRCAETPRKEGQAAAVDGRADGERAGSFAGRRARRLRAACRRPVMGGDGLIFGQLP